VRHRRATKTAIVLCVALLVACTPVAASGPGYSGRPRHSSALVRKDGRWFVDARGRVVGFRGVNFVQKFPPIAPAAAGFDEDDAAFLAREGFNVVRLGVVFGSVMPAPGQVDGAYVASIARTTRVLARHRIHVLLDFHQDGYGPLVHGNGFPEWATITDGLPNPDFGFPGNYVSNPALQRAFDNFWDDVDGPDGVPLQTNYAIAVRAVARAVAREPYVLGYDLMNEPWPGADWSTCLNGCPELETARLLPFARRMTDAIRTVDRHHLVFDEPFVLFNFGFTGTVVPAAGAPNAALSFHVYAVSPADEPAVVDHALAAAHARGAPPLATEYGATTDPSTITRIASTIESKLVSWIFWSYDVNLVVDKSKPPTSDNVRQPVLDALDRPYAVATAGTPATWQYDAASHDLRYSYTTAPVDGTRDARSNETEILLPRRAYATGYRVETTGGRIVSKPCASLLRIRSNRHASTVAVHVTPAPCS
jgi:endoglycosylceramidase